MPPPAFDNFHGSTPLTDAERIELNDLKGALWQFLQLRAPSPGVTLLALIHIYCNVLLRMVHPGEQQARLNWTVRMLQPYFNAYKQGELRVPR